MKRPVLSNPRFYRYGLFALVALAHLLLILYFRFTVTVTRNEEPPEAEVMKLVDFREFVPPPPPPPPERDIIEVTEQPASSETVIAVEQEVVEVADAAPAAPPDYLPQHLISDVPVIPVDEILDRIEYPLMAERQGIEGIVYLELYIDRYGRVRDIAVLKDPGHGFAEAAVAAMTGIVCTPAMANGEAVAVRYRYPVRFTL